MMKNVCKVCGKIKNEKQPYCLKCYNVVKNNEYVYKKICEEWKLDAKQEDRENFYFVEETNEILSGRKNLIIGRKGEGKTAIAQYIYESNDHNVFTEKLSLKHGPLNFLYGLNNSNYTAQNQYITIWKYIIYTTICKQMLKNQNINSEIRTTFLRLFPETDHSKSLSRIDKSYFKSIGIQVLGSGLKIETDKSIEDKSWIDRVDMLEELILENIDDSKYFIIFDELDEDYKEFGCSEEKAKYFDLITGLFKAVQDVKITFSEKKYKVNPLIFLRSDIFRLITYSDKNKWSDYIIKIDWTREKIKSMLTHRLNIAFGTSRFTFEECWRRIFGRDKVYMGSRKQKRMSSFDYILRSTQNRPRDFIKYFQECSKLAIEEKSFIIGPRIIKRADSNFSEYVKNEIIDELYPQLPEYEEMFAILSQIRKQTFAPKEFEIKYNLLVQEKQVVKRGAEQVLKLLFDFSIIGNVPSIQNQAIFKYEADTARFNFKENIIVHRGLYKALQIF